MPAIVPPGSRHVSPPSRLTQIVDPPEASAPKAIAPSLMRKTGSPTI